MLDFISERGARCLVGRCGSTVSAKDQLKNVRSDRLLRFPEGSTFMSEGIGSF